MTAILLSLAACVGWGAADFLGGWTCRRLPTLTVLLVSTFFGLGAIGLIVLARGTPPPMDARLLWALLGGALGVAAMFLLYRAMAVGSMAIISPISSAGVVIPIAAGLFMGDSVSALQGAGIAAAGAGAVLAAREKDPAGGRVRAAKGVNLAVAAAVAIGCFFVTMDLASEPDPVYASFLMRISFAGCLTSLYVFMRPNLSVRGWNWTALVALGVVDALASLSFVAATAYGMLSIVSVISALYPAVTVALSLGVLRERPRPVQWLGICLALVGVGLIAGG